ncbi:hypothetical protein [Paracoccus sp. KR1-242]|uniref:hypothetical protein n=1 Tax=Paracoccus sp. KR1-242 TaxID=3410028 RepID=UPI003C0458B0
MFYHLKSEAEDTILVMASRQSEVDLYLGWLNSARKDAPYAAFPIPEAEWDEAEERFDVDLNDPEWRELPEKGISAESFCRWLDDMKSAGLAATDYDCARALGRRDISDLKQVGGDMRLALACQAVLQGAHPYT